MVAVRLSPFGGMVPATDDRLLPEINAALSQDTWLYNGNALGLPAMKFMRNLLSTTSKVYRIPLNFTDSLHLSASTWMEFPNADTDVVRTQVVGDTFNRFYWMSPAAAPRYAPLTLIQSQAPSVTGYLLGVPQPGNITAAASGGSSSTLKSVAYVQTFVSAYGEEGPPSNPVLLSAVKIDATVTVTLHAADPGDLGTNRNLSFSNIYRTVTASNGTVTYYFVAQVAIGTTTYADNASVATDAVIANNTVLPSATWSGPPSDLAGMVALSNGMVAAFRNNELWFCEPFRMHAWPTGYVLVTEYPIIGLGVANQMLVVATEGYAYTAAGVSPSSMNLVKSPGLLPCTSRGSIVSTPQGVFYSTPFGLVLVNSAGIQLATKELIKKDSWQTLVATNTLRAAQLGDAYYAFGQARFGVFDVNSFDNNSFAQQDFSGARRGIIIDPTSLSVAFNLLTSADPIVNIETDAWSGEVFVIRDQQLLWLDIGDKTQTRLPYVWRSKIFQTSLKKSFQAMKVYFNGSPSWPLSYVQDPQLPVMTGQVTSGVTITADLAAVAGQEPWRAASGGSADAWLSTAGQAFPHYLKADMGVARPISSYSVGCPQAPYAPSVAPKSWTLQGSNDGSTWTVLDTQTNAPAFASGEDRTYTIPNIGPSSMAYRYFKLNITACQSGTQVGVHFFQLNQPKLGVVKMFADGVQVFKRDLITSGEQWRLPSGFRADYWQFEFDACVEIFNVQAATSPIELTEI